MRRTSWLSFTLAWVLSLAAACSRGSNDGGLGVPWDGTLVDYPPVQADVELDTLAAAIATGAVDGTEGRIALWRTIMGDPVVWPEALPALEGQPRGEPHLLLADYDALYDRADPSQRTVLASVLGPVLAAGDAADDADVAVDLSARRWCVWEQVDDGRAALLVELREVCQRQDGPDSALVVEGDGSFVPATCHPELLPPMSASTLPCASYPDGAVRPRSLAVADDAAAALGLSHSVFRAALRAGTAPVSENLTYLLDASPANWAGGYLYGTANGTLTGDFCRTIVSATPPGPSPTSDPVSAAEISRLSDLDKIRATIAHETFHCAQLHEGLHPIPSQYWALEGSAIWAEDVIGDLAWPGVDTEHPYLHRTLLTPWKALTARTYANGFPFLFVADALGDPWVYAWLDGAVDGQLDDDLPGVFPNFAEHWHAASVATWNREPVVGYVNDTRPLVGSVADEVEASSITADTTVQASATELAALSYGVEVFAPDDDVDRVVLTLPDPSTLPDVEVSVVIEGGATSEVVALTGDSEFEICRRARGPCHERAPDTLHDGATIGVVWTNTAAEDATTVGAGWDTVSPSLHGTWITTASFVDFDPGTRIQLGSTVVFDEEASPDVFSEDLNGVDMGARTETCTTTGTAGGELVTTYDTLDGANATGSMFVRGMPSDAPSYVCESVGPGGQVVERTGNTFGLWLLAQQDNPWTPLLWTLSADTLTIVSAPGQGAVWTIELQRAS